MKNLNMENCIKRYNRIMDNVGYEHHKIGDERFSEGTENWNLRDMVAECSYILSLYSEPGCCRCDDRFLSKEDYKIYLSESGMLKRFIKTYEPFVEGMVCSENHVSRFDNAEN